MRQDTGGRHEGRIYVTQGIGGGETWKRHRADQGRTLKTDGRKHKRHVCIKGGHRTPEGKNTWHAGSTRQSSWTRGTSIWHLGRVFPPVLRWTCNKVNTKCKPENIAHLIPDDLLPWMKIVQKDGLAPIMNLFSQDRCGETGHMKFVSMCEEFPCCFEMNM